ncbi:small CPxCG-related zinc finger protein [Halogeometricum pallidum JCM 14848]|uniref:Small CPxCG-related zinc finger protein n=1 Tax=Halogeometricum pallidum JCM 14848 TaxID=1227487 RepID=M0DFP2_HALPD|nr:small CPxCG-related zinc finger protein [Halogeometricum pallidum]ELZ33522.1 small CPxCG-related zinc finger protein [Halogeometricum pallidum JCM 14848]
MPSSTHTTQRTADISTPDPATAPIRPAVVDADPTVRDPDTSATTTSRAVAPRVTLPNQRLADGHLGESYLVWRCLNCGETGSLTAFPARCPDCRSGRESLAYWLED